MVKGFFCVNVPYMFPLVEIFGRNDKVVLDEKVVLFKSQEWRGDGDNPPEKISAEINGWDAGSVKSIYTTSDGGFNMTQLYLMVGGLDHDRVVFVNHEQLIDLALQAEK